MDLTALVVAMSIPSAITGFCFWMLEKHLDKKEKIHAQRDIAREKNEILMVKSIGGRTAKGYIWERRSLLIWQQIRAIRK